MDKIENLAKRVLRECNSFPDNDRTPFGKDCKQLAQAVIDIGEESLKYKFMQEAIEQARQEQREKDARKVIEIGRHKDPELVAKEILEG